MQLNQFGKKHRLAAILVVLVFFCQSNGFSEHNVVAIFIDYAIKTLIKEVTVGEKLQFEGEKYQDEDAREDSRDSYPPFDPENAQALKDESKNRELLKGKGLSVGAEEARKIGEMSLLDVHDSNAKAEEALESGLTSGVIEQTNASPEQQVDANRQAFGEIQKRRAFITDLYPVLTEARKWDDPELNAVPTSVRREYSLGETITRHMINGVPGQKMLRYESGVMMPENRSVEDMGNMISYEEAKLLNNRIFDQDALDKFQPKETNPENQRTKIEETIGKIRQETDLSKLDFANFVREGGSDMILTDIEDALRQQASYDTIVEELSEQRDKVRYDQALENYNKHNEVVEKIRAEQQQLEDEYKNANPIKRMGMIISGYRNKRRNLKAQLEIASHDIAPLQVQYEALDKYMKSKEKARNQGRDTASEE